MKAMFFFFPTKQLALREIHDDDYVLPRKYLVLTPSSHIDILLEKYSAFKCSKHFLFLASILRRRLKPQVQNFNAISSPVYCPHEFEIGP